MPRDKEEEENPMVHSKGPQIVGSCNSKVAFY